MAVEYVRHSTAFTCETCDCIDGIAPKPTWKLQGEPTDVCFRRAITPLSRYLLSLVPHYQSGHLYRAGGIDDQPAIYIDAMTFITGYLRAIH